MQWRTRALEWVLGEFLDLRRKELVLMPAPDPVVVQMPSVPAMPVAERPKDPRCGTCRFWVRVSDVAGRCHFAPPTLADRSIENRPRGLWISTAQTDWCGSYES
jgi:hypothetical protein